MSKITIQLNANALAQAIARKPEQLARFMKRAIDRITHTMARDAKGYAAKATSGLVNAINAFTVSPFEGFVVAGKDYAPMVEGGTDGSGKMPPIQNLIDWIRVKRITPNNPGMSDRDLAFVIGRDIAEHGTPAQPFMQPSQDKNKTMAMAALNGAVDMALEAS